MMKLILAVLALTCIADIAVGQDEDALAQYKSKYEERLHAIDQARDLAVSNAPSHYRLSLQNMGKRFLGDGDLENFEAVTNALHLFEATRSVTTNDIDPAAPEQLRLAQKLFAETPVIEQRRWLQARQELDRYYIDALEKLKVDLTRQALTNPASVKSAQAVREEIELLRPRLPLPPGHVDSPTQGSPLSVSNSSPVHARPSNTPPPQVKRRRLAPNLMTGLLAFYPLDGSAEDHSGNGRNANARGGAPANDRLGIADGSFALDGIDDYVELPKDIRPKSVSVSLWFRAGRPPHWSTLLRQRYFGFGLALDESGKLLASVFTTPSENTYYRLESSSVVADGAWHHAVMTYGLAGFVLYIDGRKQGVPRTDLGLGPIYYADFITKPGGKRAGVGGAAFTLGQEKNMAHLDGALDDVGIWDRQITDNEVLQLYQSR